MRIVILGSGPTRIVEGEGKNRRTNSSAILEKGDKFLLIDATPHLIEQMEKNHIERIDGLLISHAHKDAIGGIPQLREWLKEKNINQIPVYTEQETWNKIKGQFKQLDHLDPFIIKPFKRYDIIGFRIIPVRVPHSIQPGFPTCSFQIDNEVVYAEDIGEITKDAEKYFKDMKIIILDGAMWFGRQIKGHLSVNDTINEAKRLNAKNLFIIQAGHTYPKYDDAVGKIESYWNDVKDKSEMEIFLTFDGMEFDTQELHELFTYIGSKRLQLEFILDEIPDWVKTVFDGMCGSSLLLRELKARGCDIVANDISPMAYYWSKAILGDSTFSDSDLKELMNAKPVEGWLTESNVLRPERKEARMYIDGLCVKANSFEGRKKELALGILSSLLSRLQGSLGIFKKEFEPYPIRMIKRFLVSAMKKVNSMIVREGSAEVTMKDVSDIDVRKCDLVYFDPPYDMKGAEEVPYGPHYTILNSVLMQRSYKIQDFPRHMIPDLLKKFSEKSKLMLVSTSSSPTVDYRKILSESNKHVTLKRFRRRTGGAAPKAAKDQTDLLWIASSFDKMEEQLLFESKEGMYLPEPHARLLWDGKKTLIVKARYYTDMIGKLLYVIDQRFAYAVVRLKKPFIFDVNDFEKYRDEHHITDEEKNKWWKDRKKLFGYPFDIVYKYDTPRRIEYVKGTQTFVKNVKFLSYIEMIEDVSSYDPRQVPTEVLRDDWRIVCAWYSTKKGGGEIKHSIETIINLAKLIHDELLKRGTKFHPETMTPAALELYLKVIGKEGIFITGSDKTESLRIMEPMLKEFKDFKIIKNFMSIVGSTVKHPENHFPNDIDIHVRMGEPNQYMKRAIEVRLLKMVPEELGEKLHFIWGDPEGSHDTFVPLYDLALVRTEPEIVDMQDTTSAAMPDIQRTVWGIPKKKKKDEVEIIKNIELGEKITLMKPFKSLKPSGKHGVSLFYDLKELMENIKPSQDSKYFIEEKFDGFRGILHKKGNEVKIFSDQGKDITDAFPTIVEQAKEISDKDFIFDGEIVPYNEKGESLGRRGLMEFIGAIRSGKKLDDSRIVYNAFDVVYFNDKPINDLKLYERKKILETLKFKKNIKNVPSLLIDNSDDLKKAIDLVKSYAKSEGAVLKQHESLYLTSGSTDQWIKFRKVRDVHVRVIAIHKVEGTDAYNYECGVDIAKGDIAVEKAKGINPKYIKKIDDKLLMTFGNTFNTLQKFDIGDIIDVDVQEIWKHESSYGTRYSWHKPNVRFKSERKETSTFDDLDSIVDSIGILVKEMEEYFDEHNLEELVEDEEGGTRSAAATKFWDDNWYKMFPKSGKGKFVVHTHWRGLSKDETKMSHDELLDTDHSIHADIRFESDPKTLYGFTTFLGKASDVKKEGGLRLDKVTDNKLQGSWKLPQPYSWLTHEGISEPGGPGSTSDKYAKFFIMDSGTYEIGVWRKHSFEFFLNGKRLKGRYIITYAPIGERRVWLISKPADQRPFAETHKLGELIKELKQKGQKWIVWCKPGCEPRLIDVESFAKERGFNDETDIDRTDSENN